jgi:hypothetical protein
VRRVQREQLARSSAAAWLSGAAEPAARGDQTRDDQKTGSAQHRFDGLEL